MGVSVRRVPADAPSTATAAFSPGLGGVEQWGAMQARPRSSGSSPAVCSALYILDSNFKRLLHRDWRGDSVPQHVERFAARLIDAETEGELRPIFEDPDVRVTYCYVQVSNLYFLATCTQNANAMALLSFLHALIKVLTHYFTTLEEESIRDNFVIIYELLDEVCDNGYPQFTEAKILSEFIKTDAHALEAPKAPMAVTNAVSWRSEGIRYPKNEVFLDVLENVNLIVNADGKVVNSEIKGSLNLRSHLSGMPECKLGLNDKVMLQAQRKSAKNGKSVELEDIKFHQCVRLARFETDRTISFIPPDGTFDLMNYRITARTEPLLWVETRVERPSRSRVEYTVKLKTQFKARLNATGVEITLPVPSDCVSPEVKAALGSVTYAPEQEAMLWKIKTVPGGKEILMRAKFNLPSVRRDEDDGAAKKPPITVKYEIPYYTVSGVQVRYLKVIEKSGYQALPWVRYITRSGNYEFRLDPADAKIRN